MAAALCLAGLSSCDTSLDIVEEAGITQSDALLDGAWKVEKVSTEAYLLIDPGASELMIFFENSEDPADPFYQLYNFRTEKGVLYAYPEGTSAENMADPATRSSFRAGYVCDGEYMHLTVPVCEILPAEWLGVEPGYTVELQLTRDFELENSAMAAAIGTKGLFSKIANWFKEIVQEAIDKLLARRKYHEDNGIPAAPSVEKSDVDIVTSRRWPNTNGWSRSNWMTMLDPKEYVCNINIPGTHDSATQTSKMGATAKAVHADCQTLSIQEQYEAGARYFDLRVGVDVGLVGEFPTVDEVYKTGDLTMYHGPLSTNTKFIDELNWIAAGVLGGEFAFVNVQPERESAGVDRIAAAKLTGGQSKVDELYAKTNNTAMEVAHRLLRDFKNMVDTNLFIPFDRDLTVEQARGHIILIMPDSYKKFQNGLKASYLHSWPDDNVGFATIYSGDYKTSEKENMFAQSIYEVKTDDGWRIDDKVIGMWDVASTVSSYNEAGRHLLGFSCCNANTGSMLDLETFRFAHAFNGWLYELYVDNMKNATSKNKRRFRCGIVPMDQYGVHVYERSVFFEDVLVYGDDLSWAVIESNFYKN